MAEDGWEAEEGGDMCIHKANKNVLVVEKLKK